LAARTAETADNSAEETEPLRFLFFAGKGGVGKTTCAAATALRLAESGERVLLVSTDPAHSLGDALGLTLSAEPVLVPLRKGAAGVLTGVLAAAELDAVQALARWMGENRADLETLAERGTWLDHEDVRRLLDLSLPGIDELFGLAELLRLARRADGTAPWQTVVVDTAPTAHTLRLLAAPGELRRFAAALDSMQERHRAVAEHLAGSWHPDRSDDALTALEAEGRQIEELLRDPARAAFHWLLLPEALSVAETRDGIAALESAGLAVAELVVNRLLPPPPPPTPGAPACPLCAARLRAEREAVAELREAFPERPLRFLPELEKEPRGAAALRRVARRLADPARGEALLAGPLPRRTRAKRYSPAAPVADPAWLVKGTEIIPAGARLLFFGGKGGVGKTTCAAATALLLAAERPERRVLLLSTDPAHSLADVLGVPLGDEARTIPGAPPGLRVRELDAAHTFAEWRSSHFDAIDGWLESAAGGGAEAEAWRGLLDLAPPGLDELSAVAELADAAEGGDGDDLLVIDTAPTGHALRLLETPALLLGWVHALLSLLLKYREAVTLGRLAAELVDLSRRLKKLSEALRDPERTRFLAVTRPAELPRRETVRLLATLDRLGIAAPAVVVNAVLPAGCPRCDRAAGEQGAEIGRLRRELAGGCAIIAAPAVSPPPRGVTALADWGATWERTTV
jgi:arsenite-transporting ATPase